MEAPKLDGVSVYAGKLADLRSKVRGEKSEDILVFNLSILSCSRPIL